jgi:hypothetical protein
MKRLLRFIRTCVGVSILLAAPVLAQAQGDAEAQGERCTGPIIDMHLHGYTEAAFPESPPPNMATGETSVQSAREHMEQTIEIMHRHNVVLGAVCTVPAEGQAVMEAWAGHAPDMVLRGIAPDAPTEFRDPSSYRELAQAGGSMWPARSVRSTWASRPRTPPTCRTGQTPCSCLARRPPLS